MKEKVTIEQLREQTYKEATDLLDTHGKCAIIRPTGFGKTGLLTRICKDYKNVLFLYPSDPVREAVFKFYYGNQHFKGYSEIPNVTFSTFMSLIKMTKREMEKEFKKVDLIVTDECHRLGGKLTYQKYSELINVYKGVPQLGATATPDRMDLIDEIGDFYDNKTVSRLTMHDAISKYGILKKPYYCYCSYGQADLNEVTNEFRKNCDKLSVEDIKVAEDLLRTRLIEISNLQNMSNIVRECCQYAQNKSYVKFIVFFANFDHMRQKGDEVRSWFQDAFPSYSLNILRVSSETKEYRENVYNLEGLTYRYHHIDLIYCVDIMNLGYHTDNLTGIVMYRGTASGIIYQQQLGRIMGAIYSGIVIDVVDNIHRKAIYDNLGKSRTEREKDKLKKKIRKLEEKQKDLKVQGLELTDEEQEELNQLKNELEALNSGGHIDWGGDKDGGGTGVDTLLPEDLIAIGHEATYRELIAKTVAEPISMRCRQAWARWKECGGNDQPFFREYIEARGLMGTSREGKDQPLWPFCEEKNVSVNSVLNVIGVPKLPKGQTVKFED